MRRGGGGRRRSQGEREKKKEGERYIIEIVRENERDMTQTAKRLSFSCSYIISSISFLLSLNESIYENLQQIKWENYDVHV